MLNYNPLCRGTPDLWGSPPVGSAHGRSPDGVLLVPLPGTGASRDALAIKNRSFIGNAPIFSREWRDSR